MANRPPLAVLRVLGAGSVVALADTWTFDDPADYDYDPGEIVVSGAAGSILLAAGTLPPSGALSAAGGDPLASGTRIAGGGGGADGRHRVGAGTVDGISPSDAGFQAEADAWSSPPVGSAGAAADSFPTEAAIRSPDSPVPSVPTNVRTGFSSIEDPDGGSITFALSEDGATLRRWNGSAWAVSSGAAESTDAASVDPRIGDLDAGGLTRCASGSRGAAGIGLLPALAALGRRRRDPS